MITDHVVPTVSVAASETGRVLAKMKIPYYVRNNFVNVNLTLSNNASDENIICTLPALSLVPMSAEDLYQLMTFEIQFLDWKVSTTLAVSSALFLLFQQHRWFHSLRLIAGQLTSIPFRLGAKSSMYFAVMCLWLAMARLMVLIYQGNLISDSSKAKNWLESKLCVKGCLAPEFRFDIVPALLRNRIHSTCIDSCLIDEPFWADFARAQTKLLPLYKSSTELRLGLEVLGTENEKIKRKIFRASLEQQIWLRCYREERFRMWKSFQIGRTPFSAVGGLLNLNRQNHHLLLEALPGTMGISMRSFSQLYAFFLCVVGLAFLVLLAELTL